MATTEDFVGRNCPFCGAVNSLEVDDARGEVACIECARVVAMGLEESVQTRYDKDATYEDVDRHALRDGGEQTGDYSYTNYSASGLTGIDKSNISSINLIMNRNAAAARAAGLLGSADHAHKTSLNATTSRYAQYEGTKLHPRMKQYIESLCRIARRGEEVTLQALRLARVIVGYRRDRGIKIEHMNEVGAACVLIATELCQQPLPLPELRNLDPTLKNVEMRRREVIHEAQLQEEESSLHTKYALHLIRYYIKLMRLQVICYESACMRLLQAINKVAQVNREVDTLIETERIVAAVLLARTCNEIVWESKPPGNTISQMAANNLYNDFASVAHLNAPRIQKIMQIVQNAVPDIKREFNILTKHDVFANQRAQITKKQNNN